MVTSQNAASTEATAHMYRARMALDTTQTYCLNADGVLRNPREQDAIENCPR